MIKSNMIKKSKILIIGGYGYSNMGDEAILGGLLKYIENILGYNKSDIIIFSNNPKYTMNIHNVKATNKLYGAILKKDIVIIGGGELFSEYKNLLYKNLLLILICKLLNKKIYLIGIGIDIKKSINKLLLKFIFPLVDNISVRDRSSLQILHNIGIKNVKLIPDLAFNNLEPRYSHTIENFLTQHGLTPNNFIIIVVRPFRNPRILPLFANIIRELAKDNHIVFVPFSKHPSSYEDNDLNAILPLKEICEDIYLPVFDFDNIHPNELLYLISKSRLVISSRLHPLIFAKVVNVKSIALLPPVQTCKVQTFAEENNIPIVTTDNLNVLLYLIKNMST